MNHSYTKICMMFHPVIMAVFFLVEWYQLGSTPSQTLPQNLWLFRQSCFGQASTLHLNSNNQQPLEPLRCTQQSPNSGTMLYLQHYSHRWRLVLVAPNHYLVEGKILLFLADWLHSNWLFSATKMSDRTSSHVPLFYEHLIYHFIAESGFQKSSPF